MASSQNPNTKSLEYTHKKFNCGYFHKKLRMRLIRRKSREEKARQHSNQEERIQNSKSSCHPLESSSNKEPAQTNETEPTKVFYMPTAQHHLPFYALQQTAQQSREEYNLKLQRQRAALYMKHVMQFYENSNGWPTVHPNAMNKADLYYQPSYKRKCKWRQL